MSDYTNKISASIVIYNSPLSEFENLLKVLLSLKIKTFIIDNSTINNIGSSLKNYSNTEYIFTGDNLGYGKAHNIGISKSIADQYKYHIVLNPDIETKYNVFDELYQFMQNNKETGLCMPDIVYPNHKRQHLSKLLPTPFDLLFRRFIPLRQLKCLHNKKFELRNADYSKSFNVPSLSGCFMFMRNETLEKIGLFDENIFMYCEDIDLCRRIGQITETKFVPTTPVIHRYNKESYRNLKLLKYHIQSAFYYFNKWGWLFDKERHSKNKKTIRALKSIKKNLEQKVSFESSNFNFSSATVKANNNISKNR